jgi:hypothetical protein
MATATIQYDSLVERDHDIMRRMLGLPEGAGLPAEVKDSYGRMKFMVDLVDYHDVTQEFLATAIMCSGWKKRITHEESESLEQRRKPGRPPRVVEETVSG